LEESDRWRLRSPSLLVLGFGTQFLDAELDGLPDLIVANGHIDDYGGQEPLEMQPQYYRNVGRRFAEWPAARLGPFFTRKYLGRGLALIDYNRDGREDFVVSHIGAKAALVENRSANPGHFLAVDLVATRSARDGFATRVTVEAGRFRRVRQLVAGSGYQASNERQLVFGLGKHERIDRLTVRWPSGKEEVYEGLAVDRRVKLVELRGLW
ncbi:MAG TPA: CRTAC1 family protein, partial [Planctomycetaceae bacterium]|nr:CRTAC1 family protein [Planctomycetaceae bacterium]